MTDSILFLIIDHYDQRDPVVLDDYAISDIHGVTPKTRIKEKEKRQKRDHRKITIMQVN